MKKLYLALLISVFALSSCNSDRIYLKYRTVGIEPRYEWNKKHSVKYEFSIKDTSEFYDIGFNIRHVGFMFTKLRLSTTFVDPNNNSLIKFYEIDISKDNEYLGSVAGDIYDLSYLAEKKYKFTVPGTYSFVIEHNMPEPTIQFIMDIGLYVDKSVEEGN